MNLKMNPKMNKYLLTTIEEYKEVIKRGQYQDPLICSDYFVLSHWLRVSIQCALFGKYSEQAKQKFYRWVYNHKTNICENCGKPLTNYSSANISHIISRGASVNMALDPRNVNLLCFQCHSKWETGNRKEMIIYSKNQKTIKLLRDEYKKDI